MAILSIFSGTPALVADADSSDLSLATEFSVLSAASVTKIRWIVPTSGAGTAPRYGALFACDAGGATGTMVYGAFTFPAAVAGTWCEYTLPTPFVLTVGQRYRVVVNHTQGKYPATAHYFDAGGPGATSQTIGGVLYVPNLADSLGQRQGSFTYTAGNFPDGTYNAGCYYSDVVIDAAGGGGTVHPLSGTVAGVSATAGSINKTGGPQIFSLTGTVAAVAATAGTIGGGTAVTGGRPKVWNGAARVAKPGKKWNGTAWVEKPFKKWNGSAWVKIT